MPETLNLSEAAVGTLRLRIKGHRLAVNDQRRGAHRELAAAGIMEMVAGEDGEPESDHRFTADGWRRREEILREEEDRIDRERYAPPDGHISEAAKELLRSCIDGELPEGNETNRPAYRELAEARIIMPMGSFTKGDECVFAFTYWGWKMRHDLAR